MVSIVENWSDITGVIRSFTPTSPIDGFATIVVMVQEIQAVQGYTNLLGQTVGRVLTLLVPVTLTKQLGLVRGMVIRCRVRLGNRQRAFIHPEHISVVHPGS